MNKIQLILSVCLAVAVITAIGMGVWGFKERSARKKLENEKKDGEKKTETTTNNNTSNTAANAGTTSSGGDGKK